VEREREMGNEMNAMHLHLSLSSFSLFLSSFLVRQSSNKQ
jgi:hypothetical protein